MNLPPQLSTFLIAALPISELRGAIPVALTVYHLPLWQALFWAVLGNIFPIIFVLWLLEPVSKFLMQKSYLFNRFFTWLFEKTRKKTQKKFELYKELSLIIFVAIPLPFTGAWTGAVAAFIFGVPFKKALPLIFLGILIAATLVTFISWGGISLKKLF